MTTTTTATGTTTSTKLLCPECRRENEAERIYCHDCGTRLDRSAVRYKKEPIQDTHKRVKRMFDPQGAKLKALASSIVKLLFGAGALALVVDMALPPDVPPAAKNQMMVSTLRFELESMATKRQPAQRQVSEQDANAFVASALKTKQTTLDKPFLPFKRALISLKENRCGITVERSLSDYWPLYTRCVYAPELRDGRISGKVEAGYIGRLPIHPKLAQHMNILFGDVFAALNADAKLFSKLGAVEFHDKNVTLTAPLP